MEADERATTVIQHLTTGHRLAAQIVQVWIYLQKINEHAADITQTIKLCLTSLKNNSHSFVVPKAIRLQKSVKNLKTSLGGRNILIVYSWHAPCMVDSGLAAPSDTETSVQYCHHWATSHWWHNSSNWLYNKISDGKSWIKESTSSCTSMQKHIGTLTLKSFYWGFTMTLLNDFTWHIYNVMYTHLRAQCVSSCSQTMTNRSASYIHKLCKIVTSKVVT